MILKALAYAWWCLVGLRRARPEIEGRGRWLRAAWFGVLRVLLGLLFGIVIWLASSFVVEGLHEAGLGMGRGVELLTYLAVYVPVRVIEWGIVCVLALRRWDARWIAGGVLVSVGADIPWIIILGAHLPLGRFLC